MKMCQIMKWAVFGFALALIPGCDPECRGDTTTVANSFSSTAEVEPCTTQGYGELDIFLGSEFNGKTITVVFPGAPGVNATVANGKVTVAIPAEATSPRFTITIQASNILHTITAPATLHNFGPVPPPTDEIEANDAIDGSDATPLGACRTGTGTLLGAADRDHWSFQVNRAGNFEVTVVPDSRVNSIFVNGAPVPLVAGKATIAVQSGAKTIIGLTGGNGGYTLEVKRLTIN